MSKLLMSFPEGFTPNKSQVTILTEIEKAIKADCKYIICSAPTGAGKSFIGKTIANHFDEPDAEFCEKVDTYEVYTPDFEPDIDDRRGVFALTITKSLQDQYVETFEDTGILKGQNNYICELDGISTVDTAACNYSSGVKKQCWACNKCTYYNARNNVLKQDFSTLNYSMFFALPDQAKHRKVLILDEGSELEEQLVSHFTCEIDLKDLQKYDVDFNMFPSDSSNDIAVSNWVKEVKTELVEKLKNYIDYFKNNAKLKTKPEYKKKQGEYSKLLNFTRSVNTLHMTYFQAKYIIDKDSTIIKFIPLYVSKLSSLIFNYADHIIILSATIINPTSYAKTLGIEEFKFIDVDSEFDANKAPILVKADQRINYGNQQKMLPILAKQIEAIINDEHPNQKGIIHTNTLGFAKYLKENINSDRLLVRETGVTNEDILEMHMNSSEPTILVSPSMTYGVDLKGDLGEFQIVMKTPWLPTKDPRTAEMMKLSKTWYAEKMLCTLIQACGRCIRCKTDECITYILDGGVVNALHQFKKKLPPSFLNRII